MLTRSRTSRILRTTACLEILGLLFVFSGCKPKQTAHKYTIGLGPFAGFGALYLAQDKGFFKDVGLDVDLQVLTGVAERNSALEAGRIDALAAPVDYFVLAAGNNLKATLAMAIDESNGADGIVATSSIKSISDLRGKKVAYQRGLPSEFFLRVLLMQNGLSFQDIRPIDMETAQGGAAFISHQVDAAVIWDPWLTKAVQEGGGHLLASSKTYPNLIVDCLGFNQHTIAQSPADVQKIVNAVLRAIAYAKAHPEESNGLMAPHFQVDAPQFGLILQGINFADLARNRVYFGTEKAPGPIFDVANRASAVWQDAGIIQHSVSPKDIIDVRFIEEAQ